jgi:hypothetical protein
MAARSTTAGPPRAPPRPPSAAAACVAPAHRGGRGGRGVGHGARLHAAGPCRTLAGTLGQVEPFPPATHPTATLLTGFAWSRWEKLHVPRRHGRCSWAAAKTRAPNLEAGFFDLQAVAAAQHRRHRLNKLVGYGLCRGAVGELCGGTGGGVSGGGAAEGGRGSAGLAACCVLHHTLEGRENVQGWKGGSAGKMVCEVSRRWDVRAL